MNGENTFVISWRNIKLLNSLVVLYIFISYVFSLNKTILCRYQIIQLYKNIKTLIWKILTLMVVYQFDTNQLYFESTSLVQITLLHKVGKGAD